MSRKDMEKKQAQNRVPEEKPATPLAIVLFVVGILGIAFVAFLIVWSLVRQPSQPAAGASSQGPASAAVLPAPII